MISLLARLLIKPVLTTTLAVFGSPDGLLAQEGPALQPPAPQSPPPQPAPATTFPALPAQGATPVQQQTVTQSNAELVVTLIRTSLVAVQQASATGNFTVLRDLGAPDFRERNSAADLARIFGVVREQRIRSCPVQSCAPTTCFTWPAHWPRGRFRSRSSSCSSRSLAYGASTGSRSRRPNPRLRSGAPLRSRQPLPLSPPLARTDEAARTKYRPQGRVGSLPGRQSPFRTDPTAVGHADVSARAAIRCAASSPETRRASPPASLVRTIGACPSPC